MSDNDGKKTLGVRGGPRSGNVKQSFSHGRTKNVVVETKRKRVVVPKPGATITEEELIAHCREHIAGYKLPRSVTVRNADDPLPKSGAGKILKRELRAPHWEGHDRQVG